MMHPGFPGRSPITNDEPRDQKFLDLMNQTDAEMQRLGWGIHQGREHLSKCFGVRSRLLLSEEELDNFLLFLQLTDTPNLDV